jgi:uncharacterized protein (TIGR02285 family)
MRKLRVVLILLFLCNASIGAQDKVKITLVADQIDNQRQLPQLDLSSRIIVNLQEKLSSDVKISYERADRTREWLLLKKRPDVCLYNKIKTKARLTQGLYTKTPMNIFPANRLVVSKKLNVPQYTSISEAIHQYGLKIGVVAGRSYGEAIDRKIAEEKQNLVIIRGEYGALRLRSMLMQNKLDGIIEYQEVFIDDIGKEKSDEVLTYIEMSDIPPFILGYIVCSKSVLGEKAVEMFDELLLTKEVRDMIIEEHKREFSSIEKSDLLTIYQQASSF